MKALPVGKPTTFFARVSLVSGNHNHVGYRRSNERRTPLNFRPKVSELFPLLVKSVELFVPYLFNYSTIGSLILCLYWSIQT